MNDQKIETRDGRKRKIEFVGYLTFNHQYERYSKTTLFGDLILTLFLNIRLWDPFLPQSCLYRPTNNSMKGLGRRL